MDGGQHGSSQHWPWHSERVCRASIAGFGSREQNRRPTRQYMSTLHLLPSAKFYLWTIIRTLRTASLLLLRSLEKEVHTAYDGLQAVRLAAEFQPDLVLLDIGLPTLNGYKGVRQIREQPGGQDRLLIALTGWGQDQDRRCSKEAGFGHHLAKPMDFGVLRQLVSKTKLSHPERRSAKR